VPKGRGVRRICDGAPEKSVSLPQRQRTAGGAGADGFAPAADLCRPEMSRATVSG